MDLYHAILLCPFDWAPVRININENLKRCVNVVTSIYSPMLLEPLQEITIFYGSVNCTTIIIESPL